MIRAILTRTFEAAKAAARWATQRPKDAIIIALLFLLAFLGWRLKHEKTKSQELAAKSQGLPPDTQQVTTIYRDRVVERWRDGPTKIEYRDRYLPPEGHIEVTTKTNTPEKSPQIVIKDHGFTHRLGGGILYSGKPLPMIDLKWAYWRRYSATIGITPEFGGLGISRHVDDFTPFENLEIFGMAGPDWAGRPRLGIGLRTNF
ncbi:MAG: hypothetical protein ACYCPQ_00545 [Elusimicrobiota bacterium]